MKEELNVALVHLEAAMAALGKLAEALEGLEQTEEVYTAQDVVNDAAYGLQKVERAIGDIEAAVEEMEDY